MNTFNPNNEESFKRLLASMKEDFSLSQSDSQKLNHVFYSKLKLHEEEKKAHRESPFLYRFFSQKIVLASFSLALVVSGVLINYSQTLSPSDFYVNNQTALIQNNIALLVKNPDALSPDVKSSILDAHKAYASSIEEHVIAAPENSLVESSGVLGLYESALSMVMLNKDASAEVVGFLKSLVDDTLKRTDEYREQVTISTIVSVPQESTRDYSQIISAISSLIEKSEMILAHNPRLATPQIKMKLNTISQRLKNLSNNNIEDIVRLLKDSTELYEHLALTAVL